MFAPDPRSRFGPGRARPRRRPRRTPPLPHPETGGKTGFAIITPKGYVSLSADDNWEVIAAQTKMPVAIIAFVVPDSAADNTDAVTTSRLP